MKKIGKAILFVLIASLVLFISYKLFYYYYAMNIYNKVIANTENDYEATVTIVDNDNNSYSEMNYLKNENYVKVQRNDNGVKSNETFQDLKNNTEVTIFDNTANNSEKNANMTIGYFFDGNVFYLFDYKFDEIYKNEKNIIKKIKYYINAVATASPTIIKTVQYEGRECYALVYKYDSNFEEIYYIEKNTYLPVAYVDKPNQNTTTYNINFREVTDEEINYPDLSEYYTSVLYNWNY